MSDFPAGAVEEPERAQADPDAGAAHPAAAGARARARAVAGAAARRSARRRRRRGGRHAVVGAGGGAGGGRRRAGARARRRARRGAVSRRPGEAYGRPPQQARRAPATSRSGRSCSTPPASPIRAGLRALYDFFHPLVGKLARSGRVVVSGARSRTSPTPEAAAAQMALDGFVRSASKEVGRKGATANLVRVDADAQGRVPPLSALAGLAARGVRDRPADPRQPAAAPAAGPDIGDGEVPWTRPLEGKVVLVTGAARGIGEATARAARAEGAQGGVPRSARRRCAAVADRARDRRHAAPRRRQRSRRAGQDRGRARRAARRRRRRRAQRRHHARQDARRR